MDEERTVHPDCRNASNPYHECSEYCFKIIAEAKIRMNKSDNGNILSAIEKIKKSMGKSVDEERKVHPDCRNASNPYHECSEYCFMIIAEAKKTTNKSDTGNILSIIEEIKESIGKSVDEERKVHPDCRNASNPYHECSEYCFEIIPEAKKRINKSDIELQGNDDNKQPNVVANPNQQEDWNDGLHMERISSMG